MTEPFVPATYAIIAATSVCSVVGFRHPDFRDRHLFSIRGILVEKQYARMVSSALLHADWNHLLLNMLSLYLFGRHIELFLGVGRFLTIYGAAILGGSLLSLWIHRHHEYRAYGASGGVCGIIFSSILLFPGESIQMFPVPVSIPAWLYAILFLVGSFLALRRQADNIGHDAHLGGAMIGLFATAALEPELVRLQPKLFLGISALAAALFFYQVKNPFLLPLSSFFNLRRSRPQSKPKTARPATDSDQTRRLDLILEKISEHGIHSLTREEKELLNSTSEEYRRR